MLPSHSFTKCWKQVMWYGLLVQVGQRKWCLDQRTTPQIWRHFIQRLSNLVSERLWLFCEGVWLQGLSICGWGCSQNRSCWRCFTANEAPPSEKIPYHHEMAQVPNFPKVLFFNCETAPSTGGQTTLVPSNVIYQEMVKRKPEFVKRLETEGVRYVRTIPENDDPLSPIGRGWKSTYLTDNKEDVIKQAKEQGTDLEWLENGNVKTTTKILPGVKVDTRTGKKTWFNSIIAAYLGWQDSRNDRKKAVIFPNGESMGEDDMKVLEEVFEENACDFMWKKVGPKHVKTDFLMTAWIHYFQYIVNTERLKSSEKRGHCYKSILIKLIRVTELSLSSKIRVAILTILIRLISCRDQVGVMVGLSLYRPLFDSLKNGVIYLTLWDLTEKRVIETDKERD